MHQGRSDELQSFHSGGKWHRVPAERRIQSAHADLLQEILIIGTGLDKSVVLLESAANFRQQLDSIHRDGGAPLASQETLGSDLADNRENQRGSPRLCSSGTGSDYCHGRGAADAEDWEGECAAQADGQGV